MKRWRLVFVYFALLATSANADDNNFQIRLVYADTWKPISYSENGKVKGLLPQAIDRILSDHPGVTIEHIAVPWARAQIMVKNGKADGMITTPTAERLQYTLRSENNIVLLPFVLATNKNSKRLNELDDVDNLKPVAGKIFCDVLGNGWAENYYKDKPVVVRIAPTIKECLRMLSVNRVDGIVHAHPVLDMYVNELGLQYNIRIHTSPSLLSPTFPLLISKKNSKAKEILTSFDKHFLEDHTTIYLVPNN
ncbi:MAG: transporter substrate-binding domain-containing protein [Magnetovibrio sp.]|nr:transporter substrate-binding domain-containing protein [Magnetovibrio sp.]